MSKTVMLALDPGTLKTGYAVFVGEKPVAWGVISVSASKETHERIGEIFDQLDCMLNGTTIHETVCEKPTGFKGRPAPQLDTLVTSLRRWAKRRRSKWYTYHPSTIQSKVKPRHVAWSKDVSLMMARTFYGIHVDDHNVADALMVGYCHIQTRK